MNRHLLCLLTAAGASLGLAACNGDARPGRQPSATASKELSEANQVSLPADSPKLARLRIGPVEVAPVPVGEVTSPGKVEANPNRLARVLLPVAGRVTEVSTRLGDFVRQGQTVLAVESPDIDLAISNFLQAEASLTQARAAQTKAQADRDRVRDLYEHQAVAQKEVVNAEALLTESQAAVEQAQASLEQAKRRLEILGIKPGQFGQRVAVRAPISGKVLEMNVAPGEFRNDTSTPLMTIADLSSVWVTAEVPETSIRLIQRGERLDVDFAAYPGEVFRARVTQIADTVDPQTRTIKVRAELDNRTGRFRPEMFGRIRHTESLERRTVVPAAAVVHEEGRDVVWRRVGPGVFHKTPVQTGARLGDRVAVADGLKEGDQVVVDGAMLLKAN